MTVHPIIRVNMVIRLIRVAATITDATIFEPLESRGAHDKIYGNVRWLGFLGRSTGMIISLFMVAAT